MAQLQKPVESALEFIRPRLAGLVEKYKKVISAAEDINLTLDGHVQRAIGVRFKWDLDQIANEASRHWGSIEIKSVFNELGVAREAYLKTSCDRIKSYEISPKVGEKVIKFNR